jgi:DNA-binding CsgD family transcriptional regulator
MSAPVSPEEILEVVPLIYEAAVLPERWQEALAAVRHYVGGFSSMFSLSYPASGRGEVLASDGFDVSAVTRWETRHGMSPWARAGLSMEAGQVRRGHEMVPVEVLRETSLYRELLEPQGIEDTLGVVVAKSPLVLGAITFYDGRLYPEDAARRLEALAPHFVRATALRNRVAWLSQRAAAFESGIERLPMGVVLVGASGEVLHANARAHKLLEAGEDLRIDGDRLACSDRGARDRLGAALAAAHAPHGATATPVLVPRRSRKDPLQLFVSPSRDRIDPLADPAALVWIQDPEDPCVPRPEALEQLFGLSPAEARMAAALASGDTLAVYADRAGLTLETARWRLKQIQAKTGTHSQAEVVRRVLGCLPRLT